MSPTSLRRLAAWRATGLRLLNAFDFISAADARTSQALARIAGRRIASPGNLKLAAPAPPAHVEERAALASQIGARPVWLAASTHAGEDEIVLAAHRLLRAEHADALLLIAPRHPERGEAVAALAGGAPRRALGQPVSDAPVYIATCSDWSNNARELLRYTRSRASAGMPSLAAQSCASHCRPIRPVANERC